MYQLRIKKSVLRQIEALPGHYRQRVRGIIAYLIHNPFPPTTKLLRGKQNIYRIALDRYRIVYRIEDDILVIEVLKVGAKSNPEFYDDI